MKLAARNSNPGTTRSAALFGEERMSPRLPPPDGDGVADRNGWEKRAGQGPAREGLP